MDWVRRGVHGPVVSVFGSPMQGVKNLNSTSIFYSVFDKIEIWHKKIHYFSNEMTHCTIWHMKNGVVSSKS